MNAQIVEHLMAGLAQHLGTRIEILVDAVAESEQAERIVTVACPVHIFRNIVLVADLVKHVQHGFVGAAMRRSPERGDARSDAGKRVGAG